MTIGPSLKSGILPRLGQERAELGGFRQWLSLGLYHVIAVDPYLGIDLQVTDLSRLVRYLAFDFERFSLSSRESYAVAFVEKHHFNFAGWPLLKMYYSAFFAAHAIMRTQGGGVVKVEPSHISHINSILQISFPNSTRLSPGIYVYKLLRTPTGTPPTLRLRPAPSHGGVHETFWKIFCSYLTEESDAAVNRGDADAADYSSGVFELSKGIVEGEGGVWFSSIRNEINYQHAYDSWFPTSKRSEAHRALKKEAIEESSIFRMDISKNREPLTAFTNVSRYLACLNIELSSFISKRSTIGHAFGQKWRKLSGQI